LTNKEEIVNSSGINTSVAKERNKVEVNNMYFYYGDAAALKNISLSIQEKKVTALIGPSGCGKSTFLRSLNRMNDLIDDVRIDGEIVIGGVNIYDKNVEKRSA